VRTSILCAALSCFSAFPASSQSAPSPVAPVAIYTDFQQPVPTNVADAVRAEVDAIMEPAGLQFEWRSLADFHGETALVALVVAHFEGRCNTDGLVMRGNQQGSLGWSEIRGGAIVPFIHVDCTRVRTFLQIDLLGCRSHERDPLYGRALGRVLAHELYHVLAVTPRHTAEGIAKEEFSAADLLAANFQLHKKEARTLRTSKPIQALGSSRQP
jgi:hypothetical protein